MGSLGSYIVRHGSTEGKRNEQGAPCEEDEEGVWVGHSEAFEAGARHAFAHPGSEANHKR